MMCDKNSEIQTSNSKFKRDNKRFHVDGMTLSVFNFQVYKEKNENKKGKEKEYLIK